MSWKALSTPVILVMSAALAGVLVHSIYGFLLGLYIMGVGQAGAAAAVSGGNGLEASRSSEPWERRSLIGMGALAVTTGLLFLIVGVVDHRASLVLGLIGVVFAVAAAALGQRIITRGK